MAQTAGWLKRQAFGPRFGWQVGQGRRAVAKAAARYCMMKPSPAAVTAREYPASSFIIKE